MFIGVALERGHNRPGEVQPGVAARIAYGIVKRFHVSSHISLSSFRQVYSPTSDGLASAGRTGVRPASADNEQRLCEDVSQVNRTGPLPGSNGSSCIRYTRRRETAAKISL